MGLVKTSRSGQPVLDIKNGKNAIAFVEVMEEFKIRNKDINRSIADILIKYDYSIKPKDLSRIQDKLEKLHGKKCLFKFTPKQHVTDILEGKVRFCTASSYERQDHNIAIKDDELNLESNIKNLIMKDEEGNPIPFKDDKITAHSTADYHVSCFSIKFDFKLFASFECDSCVVISDGEKYCEAVKQNYLEHYPNCYFWANQVDYIDICRQFRSKLPLQMRKSSDYSYQKEYRFVGFPKYKFVNIHPEVFIEIDPSYFDYQVLQLQN